MPEGWEVQSPSWFLANSISLASYISLSTSFDGREIFFLGESSDYRIRVLAPLAGGRPSGPKRVL
jgi:hypothetical protein